MEHQRELDRQKILAEILPLIFNKENVVIAWGDPDTGVGLMASIKDEAEAVRLLAAAVVKIHAMSADPDALPVSLLPFSPNPFLN